MLAAEANDKSFFTNGISERKTFLTYYFITAQWGHIAALL
jgi:hypothetical protein